MLQKSIRKFPLQNKNDEWSQMDDQQNKDGLS